MWGGFGRQWALKYKKHEFDLPTFNDLKEGILTWQVK